jgi:hypothetical protein
MNTVKTHSVFSVFCPLFKIDGGKDRETEVTDMKKNDLPRAMAALMMLVFGFLSCASAPTTSNPYRPSSRFSNLESIGTVQTNSESTYFTHFALISELNEAAYIALLETAKQEYSGNIDVFDITWVQVRYNRDQKMYEFSANGKVTLLGEGNRRNTAAGVEGVLERAAEQTVKSVPARSKIAIVYITITAQDRNTTDYIAGELEFIWVNNEFTIIDRSQLDRLRRKQNFQMSGEVDDETAVSIGKFAGAAIIVTGWVDGEGNLRRLRLRYLSIFPLTLSDKRDFQIETDMIL